MWMCFFVQKGGGGALAVVTVQTLSQQLGESVFTKTKRALIGWDFFTDGWFQFTVRKVTLAWTEPATFLVIAVQQATLVLTTLHRV